MVKNRSSFEDAFRIINRTDEETIDREKNKFGKLHVSQAIQNESMSYTKFIASEPEDSKETKIKYPLMKNSEVGDVSNIWLNKIPPPKTEPQEYNVQIRELAIKKNKTTEEVLKYDFDNIINKTNNFYFQNFLGQNIKSQPIYGSEYRNSELGDVYSIWSANPPQKKIPSPKAQEYDAQDQLGKIIHNGDYAFDYRIRELAVNRNMTTEQLLEEKSNELNEEFRNILNNKNCYFTFEID